MHTPNFNDPRNRRRAESALVFLEQWLKQPNQMISQATLNQHFGQQQNATSQWLRHQLLIVENEHWQFNSTSNFCKRYSANWPRANQLRRELEIDVNRSVILAAETKIREILSKPVEYEEKSDRLWHPIQFFKKSVRNPILAQEGYRHDYDIRACSAHVLLQLAEQQGYRGSLDHLREYVRDRREIRQQLSNCLGLDLDQTKTLLTSVMLGSVVTTHYNSSIMSLVKYNKQKIWAIRENTWFMGYDREVRKVWRSIRRRDPDARGKISAGYKSAVYRREERRIGQVIEQYLKKTKNKYQWFHDGWMSQQGVNLLELQDRIRQKTGYCLEFEYCEYGTSTT